jgi:RNA polymerase sigma-70 factor (ECF subfamily)
VGDTEVEADDPQAREAAAEALAKRAAERDPNAWGIVFESTWPQVYRFVRFRLNDPDQAEDLASQVFEIAYSRADHFDYRGVPIEAWLIGIARNVIRDHIKKRVRRGPTEELDEATAGSAPDETASVDLRSDIVGAMHALTEDQQTVLSLRFLLDRSVEETAKLMDRSEDAVKNLQRRALAAMQRQLSETSYAEGRAR